MKGVCLVIKCLRDYILQSNFYYALWGGDAEDADSLWQDITEQ